MVDSDLAIVYGVENKRLNEQVKRNIARFPEAFRFQLTKEEYENLRCQSGTSSMVTQNAIPERGDVRSQSVTLNEDPNLRSQIVTSSGHGGRRYLPYVFTEQGVSMLSAVLRSETAIKVSIQIINAFVEMRRFIRHNADVFARLDSVERRQIAFESETEKNFEKAVYHFGASMKDLGKKWFAFSRFESGAVEMLKKLGGSGLWGVSGGKQR